MKIDAFWSKIKHFRKDENWGDPSRVNPLLVMVLDAMREVVGHPFIIHCAYETKGHAPNSYHYTGDAVDFHIAWEAPFEDHVKLVQSALNEVDTVVMHFHGVVHDVRMSQICGLGIYPTWEHPGFHLDIRQYPARWGRIHNKYVSFEEALNWAKERKVMGRR